MTTPTINRIPTLYQLRTLAWTRRQRRVQRLITFAAIAGALLGLLLA